MVTALKPSCSGDLLVLRETILRHVNRRVGKSAADLLIDVEGDYGSVGERRFYRQLEYLAAIGCLRRDKDKMTNWDRIDDSEAARGTPLVYFYYLTSERLPGFFCGLCGLIGVRSSSHPHKRTLQEITQAAGAAKRAETATARAERAQRGIGIARRRIAQIERRLRGAQQLLVSAQARADLAAERARQARRRAERVSRDGTGMARYVPLKPGARQPSAQSLDSPPPAATSSPPDHPREAARRAR